MICLALLLGLFAALFALAPPPAVAQDSGTPASRNGSLVERKPGTYYLPIRDGAIQEGGPLELVLDLRADAYHRWYRDVFLKSSPQGLPKFSYDQVDVKARVEGEAVLMDVDIEIQPQASGWILVPLGLKNGIRRGAVQIEPETRWRLDHDPSRNGYACWIDVPRLTEDEVSRPESFVLSMTVLVPTTTKGDEHILDTSFPKDTFSSLEFSVPDSQAIISHKGSSVVRETVFTPEESLKRLEFAGGDFVLSWRHDDQMMEQVAPELRVRGEIDATVGSDHALRSEISLNVESLTSPFTSLTVELEEGAQLVTPEPTAAYRVRALEDTTLQNRNLVRIDVEEPTLGPLNIQLQTKQDDSQNRPRGERRFQVGHCNVLESKFQEGRIRIGYMDDVHVTWDQGQNLREERLSESDASSFRAGFNYKSQPASLPIRTFPIQTTMRVNSEYRLNIMKNEAQLVGRFTFRFPRSYREDLVFHLGSWRIDNVDSQGAVDWQPSMDMSDTLFLPLSEPTEGDGLAGQQHRTVELTVRGHQKLAAGDERLTLDWLRPEAEQVGSAAVVLIPEDDIRLKVWDEESVGFQLDRSRATDMAEGDDEGTLVYRLDSVAEDRQLVFQVEPIQRRLIISSESKLTLAGDFTRGTTEQNFRFDIHHGSLDAVEFDIAPAAGDSEPRARLLIPRVNGVEVPATLVAPAAGNTPPVRTSRFRIPLTGVEPPYKIEFSYPTEGRSLPGAEHARDFPLITPHLATLRDAGIEVISKPTTLTLESPEPVYPVEGQSSWYRAATGTSGSTVWRAVQEESSVALVVPLHATHTDRAVLIDFQWIQAGFTETLRRDRASYILRTSRSELEITMPPGAEQPDGYVDGVPATVTSLEDNRYAIAIPPGRKQAATRLELWYTYAPDYRIANRVDVQAPQISGAKVGFGRGLAEGGNSFLQIVTPGSWTVLSAGNVSEEMTWQWVDGHYTRRPRLTQSQIEHLASFPSQASFPEGMNCYLYSGLGPITGTGVTLIRMSHLLLIVSGGVLGFGLMLFYLPTTRRWGLLWVVAAIAVLFGAFYPNFAILMAELSALGLMMLVMVVLLYQLARYRSPVKPVIRGRSGDSNVTAASRATTQSPPNPLSTATAAAVASGKLNS
ncbi:MAG: hypothetical protein WDZ51_07065 [Pirellulaceae bacterium]